MVSVLIPYRKSIDAESIIIVRLMTTRMIKPGCALTQESLPPAIWTPHLFVFLNQRLFQNIARNTALKIVTVRDAEASMASQDSFMLICILSR